MKLCRFMRWKSFYGQDWQSEAHVEAVLAMNEVPCHCLRTTRPWGPDDDVVSAEHCGPDRACFEPSPLVPGPRVQV